MRLRVRHDTHFHFGAPARSVIQALRLHPRNHEGQHISNWRIDVDADCRLRETEDAFGNRTHMFSCDGPLDELRVQVSGEAEIFDTAGVLRETAERLPVALFLRETRLTMPDEALRSFAETTAGMEQVALGKLHALMDTMYATFKVLPNDNDDPPMPGAVVTARSGTAADLAHVFVAAARHFAIPARCIGGYCLDRQDEDCAPVKFGTAQSVNLHVWAEAYVNGIGWIGFDPSCGYCPRDSHVRVCVGLDSLGAAPIRCARGSGLSDTVHCKILISAA